MTDKHYTWLLVVVDDAGKGAILSGKSAREDIPVDVADRLEALPKSALRKPLGKSLEETMETWTGWKERE